MRVEAKNLHPGLQKYISHIAYNNFLPDDCKYVRIIPDGMTELVINVGKPYKRSAIGSKKLVSVSGSHYIGVKSSYCFMNPNLEMNKLSIRFRPGAITFFTKIRAHDFADGYVDAREIFGKDVKKLEREIENFKDEKELLRKIELFLLENLTLHTHAMETLELIRSIYMNPVKIKIENIKGDFSNYKLLERRFLKYLGLLPKQFMNIVKFNYSSKIKLTNSQLPLTKVAYLANYADQSHFIRHFKQFSGWTPKEYDPDFPLMISNQRVINNQFALI